MKGIAPPQEQRARAGGRAVPEQDGTASPQSPAALKLFRRSSSSSARYSRHKKRKNDLAKVEFFWLLRSLVEYRNYLWGEQLSLGTQGWDSAMADAFHLCFQTSELWGFNIHFFRLNAEE